MTRWLVPLLLSLLAIAAGFEPSSAEDRKTLDRCEAKLTACYDTCKAEKPAGLCNVQCSTVLCGLPWQEPFGVFIDRRIEEKAKTSLPGLLLREDRREVVSK